MVLIIFCNHFVQLVREIKLYSPLEKTIEGFYGFTRLPADHPTYMSPKWETGTVS